MRRTVLTTAVLTTIGVLLTGASTCRPLGPSARDFPAGSLVIPMDNCYQRRDSSTPSQSAGCTPAGGADDGVFRAYGLVYFLLEHNVPVYWAIDNTKTSPTAADVTVSAPSGVVAQRMSWGNGAFADIAGLGTSVTYIGGPFIVDAGDVAAFNVTSLLQTDPDFARFKSEGVVDIHRVQAGFHANQVRPLSGPPPKLAILNITAPVSGKTSSNVMYQYAVAAGLSWPCAGNGDCAGGLGPSCDKAAVLAYLGSPGGDPAIPQVCNGGLCAPNFNTGPGLIYDILCGGDFVPPAGGSYADTQLAKGNYKMLWIPHWDTHGPTPTGSTDSTVIPPLPPVTPGDTLAWQLRSIASFVNAGNNLFVECLGIQALEGIAGQDSANSNPLGIPATRLQTPSGILKWNGSNTASSLLAPAQPNLQIGDFEYSLVSGAITTYYPDASKPVATAYLPNVQRLITTQSPAPTTPPAWDVSSIIQVTGPDGALRGTVAYLGGHDYSPTVSTGGSGQTAGTRIVLNTLFNLGFGCADPNTACTTGLLGACAQGTLRCASGGGLQCTGPLPGALDCKTPGADDNCNGIPDANEQGCQPVACAEGATQTCYEGPAGTVGVGKCQAGQRTCTGGLWGPCAGQVLPQPEVCNGADDNCDGQKDEGALCATGYSCQSGLCLPAACNNESARCPSGFQCLTSGGACTGVPCGAGNTTCPAGQVCQSGACADPCAGVKCGRGAGCSGGQCVAGGCALTGCSGAGQVCVGGACVADPCAGSSCPEGTFCRVGPQVNGAFVADCVRSCSYVGCPAGQTCDEDGFCESPCAAPCAQGQICVAGACASDPCAGVTCGAGQQCQGGTCVDSACKNIKCPIGQCVAGQCMNGGLTTSQPTPIKAASSGGCGTGGNADLAALLLVAVALASRRRSFVPALARAARRAAPLALAILLALGSACSKSGDPSCQAPQTACGADCVDLATSTLHCGACGHGCASGFQCLAGTCTFPTGNPHLVSASPSTLGLGASPALELSFDGLAQQPSTMAVRLTGAVKAQELPVTVSGGKATLPAQSIDLTGEVSGTSIEVRLLNMPGRLVSNALQIAVVDALVARTLTPALARQDTPGEVPLTLQGLGFVSGATIAFKNAATGATQVLTPTAVTATQIQFTPPPPSTLAVGRYEVAVTNPGGASSSPVAFTVTEGAPLLDGVTGTRGTCVQAGGPFSGTAQGRFVYPSSVVHVSGNSISNSPLDTSCLSGTDALGQCVGGQLRVTADLSAVPSGTYDVTIWNPGATGALKSAPLQITVAPSCP